MNSDAFLGAVATAAAALVAIVGGLLVARVISLATERVGVSQRVDDLRAALATATARHSELDDRLLEVDLADVEDDVIDDLIAGTAINPSEVADRVAPGRRFDQVAERIHELATRVEAIRGKLAPAWNGGYTDQTREEYTDANHIDVDADDESIWDDIWDQFKDANPKPRARSPFGFLDVSPVQMPYFEPPGVSQIRAIRSAVESNELAALRRDVDDAHHQVAVLTAEVAQAELALSRVAAPRGVYSGLWVLISVVVTGVLLPLALMAADVSLSTTQRLLVLGAFALGLAALAIYLVVETLRLASGPRSSSSSNPPSGGSPSVTPQGSPSR